MQRMPRWLAPTAVFFAFAHGVLAFSTMSFIGPRAICHDCGAVAKHAYQPVLVAVLVAAIAGLGWLLTRRAIAPRGATRSRMIRA
jgi:hypothetical protein